MSGRVVAWVLRSSMRQNVKTGPTYELSILGEESVTCCGDAFIDAFGERSPAVVAAILSLSIGHEVMISQSPEVVVRRTR